MFEFLKAPFRENPPFGTPNYSKIFFPFRKFDLSITLTVEKFKILAAPFKGSPKFGNPKFCLILSFLHICLP